MVDIKEKFGTDWIVSGNAASIPDARVRPLRGYTNAAAPHTGGALEANPAFVIIGKRTVQLLAETEGVARMYNVADRMQMEPADLAPVVEWMAQNYYIRVEPDTYGNHLMQLTGRAKELLEA